MAVLPTDVTPYGRLNLSKMVLKSGNTDGCVWKGGTSSSRIVSDVANMKFISLYFDDGATSGDARAIYNRLYLTGAGGGGESLRSFTTVENVAGATAHGAHISLNFGASGTVTGLGAAVRATLHIPNTATQTGTLTALMAEIYSDGSTTDPAGATALSVFRVVNGGDATGGADVDDDAVLFDFSGWTQGAGNLIGALGNEPTWATNKTFTVKVRLPDGTIGYLVGIVA